MSVDMGKPYHGVCFHTLLTQIAIVYSEFCHPTEWMPPIPWVHIVCSSSSLVLINPEMFYFGSFFFFLQKSKVVRVIQSIYNRISSFSKIKCCVLYPITSVITHTYCHYYCGFLFSTSSYWSSAQDEKVE